MLDRNRILSWLWMIVLFGSTAIGQDQAAPVSKPEETKTETAKNRRDRLAAEVKKASAPSEAEKPEVEKTKVQLLALSGNYVDFNEALSFDPTSLLLGGGSMKQKSFFRLCEYLDELTKNRTIPHVVFDLSDSNLSFNPAQMDELTRRVGKLKSSGKRLVAWLENASWPQLMLAASCDEVVMADLGGVDFPSVAMQSLYYREAMDLLGIKASVVRAGDFKGAVEPYMNAQMSDHLRSHYRDMLSSINDARVSTIAKGRGLTVAAVREIQKKRFLLPEEAKSKGLVDRLATYGSMRETIESMVEQKVDWIEPIKKTEKEMSFFEVMSLMMNGPKKTTGRSKEPSIAVLHLSGAIMDGKEAVPGEIVAGPMVKNIEELIKDENVQGVVVRINSPGGSATASESIRQALKKLAEKKPTVVSMGEMAASGGYWISCIQVPIYAEQGTITGSIGVFSLKISFGSLLRRIGVQMETIALDNSAAAFSPDRPWSEHDEVVLQETIDDVYQRFLRLVCKSRNLSMEQVEPLAGGRVWSGAQAKQHGLVDDLGGVDDAVAAVAKKAKLEKFKTIHRPRPSTGMDIFQILGGSDEDDILSRMFSKEAFDVLRQAGLGMKTLRVLLRDTQPFGDHRLKVWALHPAEIKVR